MIELLLAYKYIILFPLTIVEGPIVTVIAGFLSTMGILNAGLVYVIAIMGDLVGDTIAYSFGRWGSGKLLYKHGHFIGATPQKLDEAKKFFASHHGKTLILSKILHGVGVVGLVAAGSLKTPFLRYIKTCFLISITQALIMLLVGVTFGHLYSRIGIYLNYYAAAVSILALAIAGIVVFRYFKSKTL